MNPLYVWEAIRSHDEDKPLDIWIWEYLIGIAFGFSEIVDKHSKPSAQKWPTQRSLDEALVLLGLKDESFNAFEDYGRVPREDLVFRLYSRMTRDGEKGEVAAQRLAERFGVTPRTIFNWISSKRYRLKVEASTRS